MSKSKPERPPRLTFLEDIIRIQRQAHAYVMEQLGVSYEDIERLGETPDNFHVFYRQASNPKIQLSRRFPLPILGADHIAFDNIASHDNNATRVINVALFQDGSPYVREQDMPPRSTPYHILANTDLPPSIYHERHHYINLESPLDDYFFGVAELTSVRRNLGKTAVVELTDDQCTAIIGALDEAHSDIDLAAEAHIYNVSL